MDRRIVAQLYDCFDQIRDAVAPELAAPPIIQGSSTTAAVASPASSTPLAEIAIDVVAESNAGSQIGTNPAPESNKKKTVAVAPFVILLAATSRCDSVLYI